MLDATEIEGCWCGEPNPYREPIIAHSCDGSGEVTCDCGGDLCVCHNHGSVPCLGCCGCESGDYDDDDDDWTEDYNADDPYGDATDDLADPIPHPGGHRGVCRCESWPDHVDLTYRHNGSARGRRAARRQQLQRRRRDDAEHRRVLAHPNNFPF